VRQTLVEIAAQLSAGYHVQEGHWVFEIKPSGFSKGTAVEAFLREQPIQGRTPVYVGDDLSDRDGFRVVEARGGISIGVGERVRAQYRLENPRSVRAWPQRALQART
jgi:trehalose 6-phosphate phosphatase